MKVYLMRHAHAEDGDRLDNTRTVTDLGFEQITVMRKFLKKANVKPDLILTSKFERAIETAEGMQRKDTPIVQTPALNPVEMACDVDTEKAWKAVIDLADKNDAKSVLVVTHGPLIQPMLAAVAFEIRDHFEWTHASVAYLNTLDDKGDQFRWFVTPKLAAHIVGHPDPKSVEPPVEELVEALMLAEQVGGLAIPQHRAVIDPLVARLQKALRIRWRAQLKNLIDKGLPVLKDSIEARTTLPSPALAPHSEKEAALAALPMRHQQFQVKFRKAVRAAYDAGADKVQDQLLPVTEAALSAYLKARHLVAQERIERFTAHLLGLGFDVAEAPRRRTLPGPTREPEEVEDELDETTADRAGGFIDRAFQDGIGYAALVAGMTEMFDGWGKDEPGETSRAETTALAEISGAYHDGGRDVARDYPGEVEKLWELEDDDACEECQANAEMDWIPEDAPFDSGDDEPPAHPNCRCSVSYRTVETEEEEEET